MISIKYALFIVVISMLTACGTPIKTSEQHENEYYSKVSDALKKGNCQDAYSSVPGLLIFSHNNKIKLVLKENNNSEKCIIDSYFNEIKSLTSINRLNKIRSEIGKMYSLQAISEATIARFDLTIAESVKEKLKNGLMPISFDDTFSDYKFLNDSQFMDLIAINTINKYKNQPFFRIGLIDLSDYVEKSSLDSAIRVNMKEALPFMKLKRDDLKIIEKIDPIFASERRLALTLKIQIEYKAIDRLTADDVDGVMKKSIRGIDWATSNNIISIEKIRHTEVTGQERTQTISYADYQVDRMAAVLLMPRNSSYLFDLVSNDISIDYGYIISYYKNGQKISEYVVKGVEAHENKRCQYKRIQNVFGGNQAAGFDANDDMKAKCSGSSKSIESMRSEIYTKLVNGILEIDDVKKVHMMN